MHYSVVDHQGMMLFCALWQISVKLVLVVLGVPDSAKTFFLCEDRILKLPYTFDLPVGDFFTLIFPIQKTQSSLRCKKKCFS